MFRDNVLKLPLIYFDNLETIGPRIKTFENTPGWRGRFARTFDLTRSSLQFLLMATGLRKPSARTWRPALAQARTLGQRPRGGTGADNNARGVLGPQLGGGGAYSLPRLTPQALLDYHLGALKSIFERSRNSSFGAISSKRRHPELFRCWGPCSDRLQASPKGEPFVMFKVTRRVHRLQGKGRGSRLATATHIKPTHTLTQNRFIHSYTHP